MNHPNASVAGATTGLAALALYIAHRAGWNGLTSQDAVIASGALISAVLFVGRRGLKATLAGVWSGSASPKAAAADPAAPPTAPTTETTP